MKPNFYLKFILLFIVLCLPILSWGQLYRVDSSYNRGSGSNSEISKAALLPNGKLLFSGWFNTFNGQPRRWVAILDSNGNLDTSFRPNTNSLEVYNTATFQSTGKILVVGYKRALNGQYAPHVIRLNTNGSLDSSFVFSTSYVELGNNSSNIYTIKVLPNDNFLLGGQQIELDTIGETPHTYLELYNSNGERNMNFQRTAKVIGKVFAITYQPDGKLLIGGEMNYFIDSNNAIGKIIRLNNDYTLDSSFYFRSQINDRNYINNIEVMPNGKLAVAGLFSSFNGMPRQRMVLLNSNGGIDTTSTLGTGYNNTIYNIASQPDGRLLLNGDFTNYNGTNVGRLIMVFPNGNLDNTFQVDTNFLHRLNWFNYKHIPDSSILINGMLNGRFYIWKLIPTGCVTPPPPTITGDTSFCSGGYTTLTSSSTFGNLWSTGDTTQSINVAQAGIYSVRAINATCTTAVSNFIQVVNRGPSPTEINIDTTTSRCLGTRIQLTPAGNYAYYRWSNGETTRSIYTRTTGEYSVQVANADSCFGLPSPPLYIVFDTVWCTVQISRVGVDSITANVWADYYIWYLDGIELLSSNTLKTIPIQGDGVYTFRAVNGTRMSTPSNPIVITSSKQTFNAPKLKLFPNPTSGVVTLTTSSDAITVTIRNTVGQVVLTTLAQPEMELNLRHLLTGVYMVQVKGNQGMRTERLVVK